MEVDFICASVLLLQRDRAMRNISPRVSFPMTYYSLSLNSSKGKGWVKDWSRWFCHVLLNDLLGRLYQLTLPPTGRCTCFPFKHKNIELILSRSLNWLEAILPSKSNTWKLIKLNLLKLFWVMSKWSNLSFSGSALNYIIKYLTPSYRTLTLPFCLVIRGPMTRDTNTTLPPIIPPPSVRFTSA